MPAIKIRDMAGTKTIEAELVTDYKRERKTRRCVVSVTGENSDAPVEIESERGHDEFEKAVYGWLLEGGRRFVARPIDIGAIVECNAYKDPENPSRTIYELTYVWEDEAA